MLQSVDESFDHVAELVPLAIVTACATIAARWDDRLSASRSNLSAQRIAVVSLVGNHVFGFEDFQQDFSTGHVVAFSFGQVQLDRLALASDRDVDLGQTLPARLLAGNGQRESRPDASHPRVIFDERKIISPGYTQSA